MSDPRPRTDARTARLVVSWALVALLLGYGVIETVITAAKLFG
ncbi:MFS transporter small subunit [Dactylosporangium sp. CA-139114]